MIIVRLEGGLGNQMFQYAAGRRLAIQFNTQLAVDISAYLDRSNTYFTPRSYELNIFNLPIVPITQNQLQKYFIYPKNIFERIVGRTIRAFDRFNVVYESNAYYNSDILRAGGNCFLIGYWQDEKYFSGIRSTLLQDFTFPYAQDPQVSPILQEIRSTNSIGIHVRRGDYVDHPIFASRYYECTPDYYSEAISWIVQRVSGTRIFFFSDEPEWIRNNFNFISDYKIIHFEEPGLDMYLMSQCKHNIIANSSYSWWAAYLNPNREKIVIAPKQWFKDKPNNPSCKEWILI